MIIDLMYRAEANFWFTAIKNPHGTHCKEALRVLLRHS
jgi:hypothetical protein